MSQDNAPRQAGLEGEGFAITPEVIIDLKNEVTDFFGDNRSTWYKKLLAGGVTFSRTSLDYQKDFEGKFSGEEGALPPLEPERINDNRAKDIAKFFVEYPAAFEDFLQYTGKNKETDSQA